MEFKNLNSAIDKHLGPFCDEAIRKELIDAAILDSKSITDFESAIPSSSVDKEWLIFKYNQVFGRKSRIISDAVLKKYKKVFENFTKAEIEMAMNAAKKDEYHISKKFQFCTLEYFSRIDQMDKWVNIAQEQFNKDATFVLPKFNVKEDI
jgi:hypothetical protein